MVYVLVDWDNQEVLAAYKTREDAEMHLENECEDGDNVSIEAIELSSNE